MSSNTIPLIDCSTIVGDFNKICENDFNVVASEFGAAMTGIGMCYLINHGLDMKKVDTVFDVSTKFFKLPSETKMKYGKICPTKSKHGYASPGSQTFHPNTTELKELWDIAGLEAYDETKFPEKEMPEFKLAFDDIRGDLENIAKKFLRCVELFLNLEKDFLISTHKNLGDRTVKSHTEMRSLYYYSINRDQRLPANAIRCGEHKDWGTLTFLMQDLVGGLEVKTSDGKWIEAVPVKDAILVNSGALLEYWTGGRFHAAPHRVRIAPENERTYKPRQSFVYFVDPDGDAEVYPVLPVLAEKEAEFERYKNKVIVAYEHTQDLIEVTFVALKSNEVKY